MTEHIANAAPQLRPEAAFTVNLDFFSGPMDLLLHLVRQQEVSIEQVKMAVIAEQYLDIVSRSAAKLDIDLASEYLVIAATLLAIKSRSLLPAAPDQTEEQEDIFEQSRFFEDLRARLRAYELTKARAMLLAQTPQLGVDTFTRIDRKALLPTPEMLAEPEDVHTLSMLFAKLLKRIGGRIGSYRVQLEPVSIVSYMMKIVDCFSGAANGAATVRRGSFRFSQLLRSFVSEQGTELRQPAAARSMIIGSFVAALELIKRGVLAVSFETEQDEQALPGSVLPESVLPESVLPGSVLPGSVLPSNDFSLRYRLAEGAAESLELQSEFDDPAERPDAEDKVIQMEEYRQARASADSAAPSAPADQRRVGNLERQG